MRGKDWYIVTCATGQENKVKLLLEEKRRTDPLGRNLGRIFIPLENQTSEREGKRVTKRTKSHFGCLFIEIKRSPEVDMMLRRTTGVANTSDWKIVREDEMSRLVGTMVEVPKTKSNAVEEGSEVIVLSGPFEEYVGKVVEVRSSKVVIELSIFDTIKKVELSLDCVAVRNN